ncbi:hypothetical protein Droror1_Dr00025908 [Drosera rotundifolia]
MPVELFRSAVKTWTGTLAETVKDIRVKHRTEGLRDLDEKILLLKQVKDVNITMARLPSFVKRSHFHLQRGREELWYNDWMCKIKEIYERRGLSGEKLECKIDQLYEAKKIVKRL